jgi:hypothetical protein
MNPLYFEKISKYDRQREPVTVSVPFAQGQLPDPAQFTISDGTEPLALQRRTLARWPDGSVKWLLVHFQPNLPGNAEHTLQVSVGEVVEPAPAPGRPVTVTETEAGVRIDTGVLACLVPRQGFLPLTDVHLNGRRLWPSAPFGGFRVRCGPQALASAKGEVKIEIEEDGPLRAVLVVRGKHRMADGTGVLDLRGRVTAYAGKPYVEVEHGVLHCEDEGTLALHEILLPLTMPVRSKPRLALGEGYYRTRVQSSNDPLVLALTSDTILYQANEHYVDSFYGDFWVDWRDQEAGIAISVHQAHQNFPKKLSVAPEKIEVALYPADAPTVSLYQGMGKTHRLLLHFHDGQKPSIARPAFPFSRLVSTA